jgi:4-amino-4-deoxychorismate lyase
MSGLIRAVPESLSALDRGLAYGDGLFETLTVRNNIPCFWDEHMQRLIEGCSRLGIPCPDLSELKAGAEALCMDSEGKDAVLKLIVTRGQGGRGYRAPSDIKPWIGMSLHHAPEYPSSYAKDGIRACICKTRLGTNPSLAGIKHLNRLE